MVSIFLRSLVFNILFYPVFIFWALVALPTLAMPRKALMRVANWWGQTNILLMRVICNIRVEYRGVEKIPKGPLIVAAKHQSMWETISLLHFFDEPFFVLKRELRRIPIFGLFLMKADMVAIDRSAGRRALMQVVRRASEEVKRGRQFVIFPEGTRRPPGAPPHYKAGVGLIYVDCGVPCLPVALNSGLFWPRNSFMRYPGTLVVEFLDPLPPGLPREEFLSRVETAIEDATNRLVAAGEAEQAQLFGRVPQAAKA
ncbi:putative 1-acylglycerol-3-phosphate O-acyltransferase (plsC) [Bradyrhizobium sp. STM 3843]|uniref:lysophospholipid acyltransferase family protein n=1 Tax=Bradyrhizobium sp. STM 3843 TaxID=551947 RepID=UPI00024043CD|nr:lysophospholipid acyltransferase family protein [Bradyrhizobium sp. STM 3843]CCE11619.1 putative 1-acylglycerol-3-phosphate O-acyltransferase (plsC) [Bradyrhizobium sp. STM 3843]